MEATYAPLSVQHGVILMLDELRGNVKDGDSVRVLGRLQEYDPKNNRAVIEHNNVTLKIDTVFLESFPFKVNSMFQFIGEIETYNKEMILKARVGRNIDEMDLILFERALKIRRDFLQESVIANNI